MDLSCAVCGEPWDAYGVRHGDMLKWESELFLKGAGCPCCEGDEPEGQTEDERLDILRDRLLINPDEDGDLDLFSRIGDGVMDPGRPKWERPEDEVLWECCDCGVKRKVDTDCGTPYFEHKRAMYRHRAWLPLTTRPHPDEDPLEVDGTRCSNCVAHCDRCGDAVPEEHAWHLEHDHYLRRPLCGEGCFSEAEYEEQMDLEQEGEED